MSDSLAGDFPPDPLLSSGDFISSTTINAASNGTLNSGAKMSNGTDQVNPSPDTSAHQTESKSRKRAAPGDNNWLPPGWRVEDRVRTNGATAGTVDRYYYEPITGRKFRSRTEVLYYLEHGTSKKGGKKTENTDIHSNNSEGQGSRKASRKAREQPQPPPPPPPPSPSNFDFENPPEKVSWCMTTNTGEEAWIPVIGDDVKVEESVRRDWSTAFTFITNRNPSKLSF